MKNTITPTQAAALYEALDAYTTGNHYPDFWQIDADGGRLTVEVSDFDGNHDFSFIGRMLESVGVELDRSDMLHPVDIVSLEREGQPLPRKAAIIEGDGEHGRLYGYELLLAGDGARFPLGKTIITCGARKAFTDAELSECFLRHERGDWGDTSPADAAANDAGLNPDEPDRLVSLYKFPDGRKLFLITEMDRSVTTALLPSEY